MSAPVRIYRWSGEVIEPPDGAAWVGAGILLATFAANPVSRVRSKMAGKPEAFDVGVTSVLIGDYRMECFYDRSAEIKALPLNEIATVFREAYHSVTPPHRQLPNRIFGDAIVCVPGSLGSAWLIIHEVKQAAGRIDTLSRVDIPLDAEGKIVLGR